MHAVDIYGLSEVIGPGVASEAVETKDGLHIWEDHFYPEVIDPVTGAVLPEGEEGELVFTSLTKQAFPVIRYRTRDLTRLLPGTARTMRRMEKITGRTDDMIILRGVNLFPSQIEEIVLGIEGLTGHFQLVLTKPGRMDEMAIHVEARPEAAGGEIRAAAGRVGPAAGQGGHRGDGRVFRCSSRTGSSARWARPAGSSTSDRNERDHDPTATRSAPTGLRASAGLRSRGGAPHAARRRRVHGPGHANWSTSARARRRCG